MKPSRGSGDKGKTSLFSGERVSKTHARIEACGDVDELCSVLGAVASALPPERPEIAKDIKRMQSALLAAGALLGTTPGSKSTASLPEITDGDIDALEAATDRMHSTLPRLSGFVIPGGHAAASWAHVARTVCRRAERRVVALVNSSKEDAADPRLEKIVVYLNRLSDWLFCLARYINKIAGVDEEIWER